MSSRGSPIRRLFPLTSWGLSLLAAGTGVLILGAVRVELAALIWGSTAVLLAAYTLAGTHLSRRLLRRRLDRSVEALDFLFGRGEFRGRSQYGPKLILLDLKLPRIDGLEVLKEIKQDPRTNKIPVVILTTSRQEIDIVRSYELGVNSYIVKPVDFEQFNEVVRQLGMYWMLLNQPPEL